jgi:hypothetical protein
MVEGLTIANHSFDKNLMSKGFTWLPAWFRGADVMGTLS